MPWALRSRISFATGVPPIRVVMRSWLPPVKNTPLGTRDAIQAIALRAVAARIEIHRADVGGTEFAEDPLVTRAGVLQATGGRQHHDVGIFSTTQFNESLQDQRIVLFFLGTANGNDETAHRAVGDPAWTHQLLPFPGSNGRGACIERGRGPRPGPRALASGRRASRRRCAIAHRAPADRHRHRQPVRPCAAGAAVRPHCG
jgi:hypothetical protein